MSSLTASEKSKLEKVFRMGNGYVLNFADRSLKEFVLDSTNLDISEEKYNLDSGSKANRLRSFWSQEPDQTVGKLTSDMLDHWKQLKDGEYYEVTEAEEKAYEESCRIVERLTGGLEVEHFLDIQAVDFDSNFALLAKQIKGNIENGEPEAGLDRLHTFVIKYFRQLCEKHGISTDREEPLNAVFGKYLKVLKAKGLLKSKMSENILLYSMTIFSKFNFVRNNQSLAHDNEMLNKDESLLIFRNMSALVKFIETIEAVQ